MTIVAWDGVTLAVDRAGNNSGWVYPTTKLHLFPRRRIAVGLAGELGRCALLAKWIGEGFPAFKVPEFQHTEDDACEALVVIDGVAFTMGLGGGLIPTKGRYHAIGSGRDFALAALELGEDAIAAVELASLLCNTCGHGVDWARCRP